MTPDELAEQVLDLLQNADTDVPTALAALQAVENELVERYRRAVAAMAGSN